MDNSACTTGKNDVYSVDSDDDSEWICSGDYFSDNDEEEDVALCAHAIPVTLVPKAARSVAPVPTTASSPRTRQKRDDVVNAEIPQKVSIEEAVRMVRTKLQVEKAIKPDFVSDEEKSTIEKVVMLCKEIVRKNYTKTKWDPKTLVDNSAGLYGMEYQSSRRKSKVGMSRYRKSRTKKQMKLMLEKNGIKCLAYSLYNMDAIRNFVTDEDVLYLKNLHLPGLCFHPDQHEKLDDLIRCQLVELAVACCFNCGTSLVGERFLQVPSRKIREMFDDKPIATPPIRGFFSKFNSVFCIYSWPTFRSHLLSLPDPYYVAKLGERPQHKFIKNYLNNMLWGGWLVGWENSVKVSPRATEIKNLSEKLKVLVDSDEATIANAPKIVALIKTIDRSSDNYSSYKYPSDEDMAKGAKDIFEKRKKSDCSTYISIERTVWNALLKVEPDWCRHFFRLDASIQVEDICGTLVECTSGHQVVVTPSYFTAMDEISDYSQRMRATHCLYTTKRLLGELGFVSKENVGDFRRRFTSFAMSLEGVMKNGEGSYREARISHLPKGFCLGSPRNILSVSKNIGAGIGYCETLFLYRLLGESRFHRMIRVFGIQSPTPLDLEFRCPGLPSVGKYPALECRAVPDESGNLPSIHMVGADTPGHPYGGCFVCGACADGYRVRARAKLQEMSSNGKELTQEEQLIHDKSMVAKAHHAKTVKESLKRKMEINPEGTMASIRAKQRRQNTKRALQKSSKLPLNESTNESSTPKKPQTAKKKGGVKRRDPSKRKHYNPRFKNLLESMFDILVRTFGQDALSSYYVNAGYNLLVETEVAAGREIGDFELKRVGENNDPIIIAFEFDEIAQKKLQKGPGKQSKLWIIREEHLPSLEDRTVAFDKRSLLDTKEYVESVVSKVYEEEKTAY